MVVEMAIIAPLLILLLFGIIEMGLLLRSSLVLGSACREATRVAGLGRSVTAITSMAHSTASTLNTATITVQMDYLDPATGQWLPLTDTGEGGNCAPVGSQVRVALSYPHVLVCGPITAVLAGGGEGVRVLHSNLIMTRE